MLTAPAGAEPLDDVIGAEFLPGWQMEDGTVMAGVRLTLEPGWKTYWRAPGDAGIPPQFNFSGSHNLASVQIHWPRPQVIWQNDMRSIGYKSDVVLPVALRPVKVGKPITIAAQVDLGVCEDICLPVTLNFNGLLPAQGGEAEIRAALAHQPEPSASAGVGAVTCAAQPISDGIRLTAHIPVAPLGGEEVAVIELQDKAVWVSEATIRREGALLVATADLVPPAARPFALDRSDVRITLLAGARAIDIRGCTGR